jgi:hypothetical protein
MAAIIQIRDKHSEGRAYYDKKLAGGKTSKQALRSLKRQVSNAIFACLQAGARRAAARAGAREGSRERLCRQRGRLAPQGPALRTSHSRTRSPPYDRGQRQPGQGCAFPGRCQPAARHGPATQGCSKTTVTLDRLTTHEKDQWSVLTHRLHATDVAPADG